MEASERSKIRRFIETCLRENEDEDDVADTESLFVSGRLNSLSMTSLVVFLEKTFGIDFSETGFDMELMDSIAEIESFINEARGR